MLAIGRQKLQLIADRVTMDMEYGEEINELCAGCHGEFGQGSGDGEYPRLAGMDRQYLVRQLQYFKDRSRLNIPMLPYATERELPDKDVQAVSAYLSSHATTNQTTACR